MVNFKNVKKIDRPSVAHPKVMSFDIEVNSTDVNAMPKAEKDGDKIFQISCIFSREGSGIFESHILSLGEPSQEMVGDDIIIHKFTTEFKLLEGFTSLILQENPNVIIGYNILSFDIPYMMKRAEKHFILNNFDRFGFHKTTHAKERTIKWSSSAYKNQEFIFLDGEGRLFIDLLPLIRRDYKMDNYKLKTVSEYFIGQTKDDLSPKGIFKCYRIGTRKEIDGTYSDKAMKAISICAKYCVQDSVLVMKLFEKLNTWVGLTEQASTYNTSIFSIFTQGQQIKVYSQVYKYCLYNNIVVEKDGYIAQDNERYTGAHVFPPVPGIYDRVVPFDFCSLYPTTMIAYNLDYSTLVLDDSIPDDKCHIFKWGDHIACMHDPKIIRKLELTKIIDKKKEEIKKLRTERDKKTNKSSKQNIIDKINEKCEELKPFTDERASISKTISKNVMCAERYYRFLKKPKGVIPTILQNLLDARANTRKKIKQIKNEIKELEKKECLDENKIFDQKSLINVLDKRQLAYKISANSMYGSFGVKRGYLPFMPGAMCTTFMGRTNIEIVANTLQTKYNGHLVYGDSVANYTPITIKVNHVLEITTIEELGNKYGLGWGLCVEDGKEDKEACEIKTSNNEDIFTWTEQGWTILKTLIRHKLSSHKKMYRVLTHTGLVDVTDDHSLLDLDKNEISPKDVHIGTELLHHELPVDFQYDDKTYSEEQAQVMGFFFGDDCPSGTWVLNNKSPILLERYVNLCKVAYPEYDWVIVDVCKISPRCKDYGGIIKFVNTSMMYSEKAKVIPSEIMMGSENIRKSFWTGMCDAGGVKVKNGYIRIDQKNQISASHICWLANSLGWTTSINTRSDKPNIYRITLTTKTQRKNSNAIKKMNEIIGYSGYVYDLTTENHHFAAGIGNMIVHNTDSNYISFPHLTTAQETWKYAEQVADEISEMFPKPIRLDFESIIYWKFLILTKKRYMYRSCDENGIIDDKVGKKGVLLARRDTSMFVKNLYEQVVTRIFNRDNRDDILFFILEELNKLCSNSIEYKKFVVTKSVGSVSRDKDTNKFVLEPYIDEKGNKKLKIGDYKVTELPFDKDERMKELKKKGCESEEEFYESCLPAQVQLAMKMSRRGQLVQPGSRIEYLISDIENHTAKQYKKIEDIDYFLAHSDILKIDHYYYMKVAINSIDEILNVVFGHDPTFKKNFIEDQYNIRYKKRRVVLNEIKKLGTCKLVFE